MEKKYCIVPQCFNSTVKRPDKHFFYLPMEPKLRKKWLTATKRSDSIGSKTKAHCCEDHFDLENDLENHMRWKIMGGALKVKRGVVPHIFDCWGPKKVKVKRNAAAKLEHRRLIQEALNAYETSASTTASDIEWVDCGNANIVNNPNDNDSKIISSKNEISAINKKNKVTTKNSQVSIKTKVSKLELSNAKTSKRNELDAMADSEAISCKEEIVSEYEDDVSTNEKFDDDDNENDGNFKFYMIQGSIMSIEKNPKLYLGIPKESYFCLKILSDKIHVNLLDILITLKKIRLNELNAILGAQFGRSPSIVEQIFKQTVPKVSLYLREFIVWPPKSNIAKCLPIAFRRYSNVQSIIDCFEIPITKPGNPLYQSLTWSEYKGSNTIKYMISYTPDGLINFVSYGFGGKASDSTIFENCGYMSNLSPGINVMADRGFENVSNILNQQQCRLIRLPSSESENTLFTKEEVLDSKNIASLRSHVKRITGRLKNFNMIAPYACVDHSYLSIYDEIVVIVCGLINMEGSQIKF